MKPFILIFGSILFCFCLFLHILIWRWRRPRNEAMGLVAVLGIPMLVFVTVLFCFGCLNLSECLAVVLLHMSLSSAYIFTYPALEGLSLSLVMLVFIGKTMPAGLTEEALVAAIDKEQLFKEKVQDLLAAGLIAEEDHSLKITGNGRFFVLPFVMIRKLLGLKMGKG